MAPLTVAGALRVPGDKSISHRALMLAALADGESRIHGILPSADVHSTAGVLRACGVEIPSLSDDFAVRGLGRRGLRAPARDLDCGNSGTTTRLMAGIVAGHPFAATFIGDESLSRRPMRRIARPLTAMGAQVDLPPHGGLPMTVHGGHLHRTDWTSEVASAQVKSAVLLAGLVAGVRVTVTEPLHTRDHTERMLRGVGVPVATGDSVSINPVERLRPLDIQVPGDPSSAAFIAALAVLADSGEVEVRDVAANPTRTGFYDVLREMGAGVAWDDAREEGGEPVSTVRVRAGLPLRGATVGADRVPSLVDEIPLIACLGSRAEGHTVVSGAGELRMKESDRIAAVVGNLRALGADAEEHPDGFRVTGGTNPLRGSVRTFGDHRIAMAFGVLAALPGNQIEIDDRDCVAVSYPGFWDTISGLVK